VVQAFIDGGNPKPIATTVGIATGVAVDPVGGKIYWTEYGNGPKDDAIRRANLDGSNVETLFDATQGLRTPDRIAVDSWAGRIYWTDLHAGVVQRSNLDGTGLETLPLELSNPRAIELLQYASCDEAQARLEADNTPVTSPSVVPPESSEAGRELENSQD
jgi:sugar lactone lactonase YvrE